jgi:AraC-like DNA-binding protein
VAARARGRGLLWYATRAQPTVGDGLRSLERLAGPAWGPGTGVRIERDGARVAVSFGFGRRLPRHAVEFVVARTARALRAAGAPPLEVSFRHGRGGTPSEYARVLGCVPRFRQPHTRVVVRDDRLGVRSPTANPVAAAALTAAIERVAAERVASVSARLAEAARTALDRGDRPTREKLARVLGMSGKTLARRLEAEHRRFRNVVDEVRRARACGLVADGRLDLSEVAARVGFADLAAFGKAFRRWFGTSPSAYRALARRPATPAGWSRRTRHAVATAR